jgi:hypothetical protein
VTHVVAQSPSSRASGVAGVGDIACAGGDVGCGHMDRDHENRCTCAAWIKLPCPASHTLCSASVPRPALPSSGGATQGNSGACATTQSNGRRRHRVKIGRSSTYLSEHVVDIGCILVKHNPKLHSSVTQSAAHILTKTQGLRPMFQTLLTG